MTDFPRLLKDPADSVLYSMDWTDRLPLGVTIISAAIAVTLGDVTALDQTIYGSGVTALSILVSGGWGYPSTGDPQVARQSRVTAKVTLTDGEILSRSFDVICRAL